MSTTKPRRKMTLGAPANAVPDVDPQALRAFTSSIPDVANAQAARLEGLPQVRERRYIRRTFSMLVDDDKRIEQVRKTAARAGEIRGKSDIVRAGILALTELSSEALTGLLKQVEQLK